MKEQTYKSDFQMFLAHTDEKVVLLNAITATVQKQKPKSMLDIGAGNGLLSVPLARLVSTYVAVEPHPRFAETLRDYGLQVIQDYFPTKINQRFDFILSSHSINYEQDKFRPFIENAWDLLKPKGTLLIVTYRGQADDWTELLHKLGKNLEDKNRLGYNQIVKLLYSLGTLKLRKVVTYVRASNITEMLLALSFVASDGEPEKKAAFLEQKLRLQKLMDTKYQNKEGYFFPFTHYFLETSKT